MNTQQNYWAAEPTNLAECHAPLFRLLQRLADTGQPTAAQMYDAPGGVAHTVTNAWGCIAPGTAMGWGLNVTGGDWLATHLWEHYEYGGDDEFLRDIGYPVLRGAALFLSYLTEDPDHGWLVAGPSESPENWYVPPGGSRCSIAMGNTVDRVFAEAILRDYATHIDEVSATPASAAAKIAAAVALSSCGGVRVCRVRVPREPAKLPIGSIDVDTDQIMPRKWPWLTSSVRASSVNTDAQSRIKRSPARPVQKSRTLEEHA